nr:hypothetical protein [Streptomyces alboflavus]
MTWDEVESVLVRAGTFQESRTRSELWDELQAHKAMVGCVVGSVGRIWLAGSFVSSKLDPEDVDLAYLLDAVDYEAVTAPSDVTDLANLGDREWCVRNGMRIDAYILKSPATKDFTDLGVTGAMAAGDGEAFQMLGLYDEIWQRCRTGNNQRRGYVEVSP